MHIIVFQRECWVRLFLESPQLCNDLLTASTHALVTITKKFWDIHLVIVEGEERYFAFIVMWLCSSWKIYCVLKKNKFTFSLHQITLYVKCFFFWFSRNSISKKYCFWRLIFSIDFIFIVEKKKGYSLNAALIYLLNYI